MSLTRTDSSVKLALFTAFNAMVVQESLLALGTISASPLSFSYNKPSIKNALINEWKGIVSNSDHEPVFDIAIKILDTLPPHPTLDSILKQLAKAAEGMVSSKSILKHDVSGRIYHRLLLDKVAKGLATFYTSVPGSYLLAKLCFDENDDGFWREFGNAPTTVDFACGSGTLISAAYSAIYDKWMDDIVSSGSSVNERVLEDFHIKLLNNSLYGFDVLSYATHLAASWLTLRMPEAKSPSMNFYTLPLGGVTDVHLGSLSGEITRTKIEYTMAKSLTDDVSSSPSSSGIRDSKQVTVKLNLPSVVIMNPPFARTGNVGKSILMGHLPSNERKAVLKKMKQFLDNANKNLKGPIGKAGIAAPFVWFGGRALKEGGKLAYVLPRVALSGPSWYPIRQFLVKDFALEHIVVSYDPSHNFAWSENTNLSEILIVAKKNKKSNYKRVETSDLVKISYITTRPRSGLEGKILAGKILNSKFSDSDEQYSEEISLRFGNNQVGSIFEVRQASISKAKNWNEVFGYSSPELSKNANDIINKSELYNSKLPLGKLSSFVRRKLDPTRRGAVSLPLVGYDVATYKRYATTNGKYTLEVIGGSNQSTLRSIEMAPNDKTSLKEKGRIYLDHQSHFLIAGVSRFRLNSIGLLSLYSTRPVISNTMWTISLKGKDNKDYPLEGYKAQVLWMNSTPGIISTLELRQDSSGALVQLKKEYLLDIPILDYYKLDDAQKLQVSEVFEKLKKLEIKSFPDQFKDAINSKGFRYELDTNFLPIICPDIDLSVFPSLYEKMLSERIILPETR